MPNRLEALPGEGNYALTFRLGDGSERTVAARVDATELVIAPANLPDGWDASSEAFQAAQAAVLAFDRARATVPRTALLLDVEGGWDVSLGNVTLSGDGVPECGAHGPMQDDGVGEWRCPECEARARFGA